MISEFLLDIVFSISSGALSLLPDITWSVDSTAFTYFLDIVRIVGYMLPAPTVVAIITLIFSFHVVRVVVAIIKSVWDLFPFV